MSRDWPPAPDMSDPRIAADFERIARGAAEMARTLAVGEAAARQHAEDMAILAEAIARRASAPAPVTHVHVVVVVVAPEADDGDAPAIH